MKIEKIVRVETEEDFLGLTLLSKEEYKKFKNKISCIDDWWWLRSPSSSSSYVDYVGSNGERQYGNVDSTDIAVRPALILNPKSSNLIIGDRFTFYCHDWTVISSQYALCDEIFDYMTFREYRAAENANDYEVSNIKQYLNCEWLKMMKGDQDIKKQWIELMNILERLGKETSCDDCLFYDECMPQAYCIFDKMHDLIEKKGEYDGSI